MNTIVHILSQLAWAVTVGALSAAAIAAFKLLALGGAALGCGALLWAWQKRRSKLKP